LGLTGGIGSGKSSVAAVFATCGATVIDADAISREITACGGTAIPQIRTKLGAGFITPEGALNRDVMRAHAFRDSALRQKLESIIHPLVRDAMTQKATRAEELGAKTIVFDIPLLVESAQWRKNLDKILVVDCEVETQVQRVMRRSGLHREVAQAIVASQATRWLRVGAADIVLCNEGISLADLSTATKAIAGQFGLSSNL
jgi:dephospho-CoA kinase